MGKRIEFALEFRQALLEAHDYKCAYNREPIPSLSALHVEHIIEISLQQEMLTPLLRKLGLPVDFDLNDPTNLLPACATCNARKGDRTYDINSIIHFREFAKGKMEKIKEIEAALRKQKFENRFQAALFLAMQRGHLTVRQMNKIFGEKSSDLRHHQLLKALTFSDEVVTGLLGPGDIEELMRKPICPRHNGLEAVEMERASSPPLFVRTCAEWSNAIRDGYSARTNYDLKEEVFFAHTHAVLSALMIAQTSSRPPGLSVSNLHGLPLELLPDIAEIEAFKQKVHQYRRAGITLDHLVKRGEIRITEQGERSLTFEFEGMGLYLNELLVADLNEDCKAALLVGAYHWTLEGSFGAGYILVLGQERSGALQILDSSYLLPSVG